MARVKPPRVEVHLWREEMEGGGTWDGRVITSTDVEKIGEICGGWLQVRVTHASRVYKTVICAGVAHAASYRVHSVRVSRPLPTPVVAGVSTAHDGRGEGVLGWV